MSRTGLDESPLVFSNSSWNLRLRTSFLDFSASMDAANFFSRSSSAPFKAPSASSTEPNLRGVFGASWSMTALSSGSIFNRALQQGQRSSKSIPESRTEAGSGALEADALPSIPLVGAATVTSRGQHPIQSPRLEDLGVRSGCDVLV